LLFYALPLLTNYLVTNELGKTKLGLDFSGAYYYNSGALEIKCDEIYSNIMLFVGWLQP